MYVKIDPDKLRKTCTEKFGTLSAASARMSRGNSYFTTVANRGTINMGELEHFCALTGTTPADYTVREEPPKPEKKDFHNVQHFGLTIRVDQYPERLTISLTDHGYEVQDWTAYIKEDSYLGFLQAASFCLHKMWKKEEEIANNEEDY